MKFKNPLIPMDEMNKYFDGSLKNLILDHIEFGAVSSNGADKLFFVAAAEVQSYQLELNELVMIKEGYDQAVINGGK